MKNLDKYFFHVKKDKQEWIDAFKEIFPRYQIDNDLRICHFLVQAFHETNYLSNLEENLNYSAETLFRLFKHKFKSIEDAKKIEYNKTLIANTIYGNRLDLGNDETGDGYRYRGRGIFQITGKANYQKYNINNPDKLLIDKRFAIEIACKFWNNRGINNFADKNDLISIRNKINGGTIGLDDCKKKFDEMINLI